MVLSLVIQVPSCVQLCNFTVLQHSRLPCHSPSPKVCPSLHPLNQWCHPTISSSVPLFSFCLQSFPALGSFPMNQLAKASASVLPKSIQGWFLLRLTGLISLLSKHSEESSPAPQFKSINSSALCLLNCAALIFVHENQKDHSLDYMDLCQQVS